MTCVKVKVYAPVVIPTLNRFSHFSKCLDSLEACTGADQTDVFIGLDYPPSEKYFEGWNKIDKFLREKEKINGFKSLNVIRREYNYGISGEGRNGKPLLKKVMDQYDRFIYSEDDNVFSPNFLEYINKGLELYKNDKEILAIVGYNNNFDCKKGNNNHFAQYAMFQAWGFGMWVNKRVNSESQMTPAYFRKILCNRKYWQKCYKYWPVWFNFLFRNAQSSFNYVPLHDINMSFYMLIENMKVICPTISKVRNMGFDSEATTTFLNKGRMAERAEIENNMPIDQNATFEFVGDPFCYVDENSYNTAMWDQKWEGYKYRGMLYAYAKIFLFRLKCLLGVI